MSHPIPSHFNKAAEPTLASVALRLLAKRPEDRLGSADETLAALNMGTRVPSPEKRRKTRRRAIFGAAAMLLVIASAWLLSLLWGWGPIVRASVSEHDKRMIVVWRENALRPEKFFRFPDTVVEIAGVDLLNSMDGTEQLVVAGLFAPSRGGCVVAMDQDRREVWKQDLTWERKSDDQWPDAAPPTIFGCRKLIAADVDGEPGKEVIVAVSDQFDYPARISILDPWDDGHILATFLHMGWIHELLVVEDFFGPGQAAIAAYGNNNKLDGFDEPFKDDESSLAHWDVVDVMMILDPADMDGLGPPATARLAWNPAKVYAYAFLDLPKSKEARHVSITKDGERVLETRSLKFEDLGNIADLSPADRPPDKDTAPWFQFRVFAPLGNGRQKTRIHLTVDRNLHLRLAVPDEHAQGKPTASVEYWRQFWHPIIHNGEYVGRQ